MIKNLKYTFLGFEHQTFRFRGFHANLLAIGNFNWFFKNNNNSHNNSYYQSRYGFNEKSLRRGHNSIRIYRIRNTRFTSLVLLCYYLEVVMSLIKNIIIGDLTQGDYNELQLLLLRPCQSSKVEMVLECYAKMQQ